LKNVHVYSPAGSVTTLSHLTSITLTKSNLYFHCYFVTVMSEPFLYRFLTFHLPNLISNFLSLGCLYEEFFQFLGPFIFRNKLVFCPTPNHLSVGTPLFGWWRLHIQYVRSYSRYLKAVPPSASWGRTMPWWQEFYLT
jgi:hypothetical protein